MDPIPIPQDIDTEAILGFSTLVMAPLIAGIAQVFVRSGLPVRHVSLLCLVLAVALSFVATVTTQGVLLVGLVRGAVVGLAAYGTWVHFSHKINTNGIPNE